MILAQISVDIFTSRFLFTFPIRFFNAVFMFSKDINQYLRDKGIFNMKRLFFSLGFSIGILYAGAQTIQQRLQTAVNIFGNDSQNKHAAFSLYVVDAKTGEVVYDLNSQLGLAPASTQKVITSAAAFELLGNSFQFKTYVGYTGVINNGILNGAIRVAGTGDPTLGSKRWSETDAQKVLEKMTAALRTYGIRRISGNILVDDAALGIQPLPEGWIWQDIGNYYGAGCQSLNWYENQYDLVLKSPAVQGRSTTVVATRPALRFFNLQNLITSGPEGSGDNGYIFYPPGADHGFATGTIPPGRAQFSIAGSIPQPSREFGAALQDAFSAAGITCGGQQQFLSDSIGVGSVEAFVPAPVWIDSIQSPVLDSVNFWFLRRSVNLFGEALARQIGYRTDGDGSTRHGVSVIRDFWKKQGLPTDELNTYDGSGLSPANRVTTHAQVFVLQYAKTRPWFASFYNALPEYNGMKMKSGTISDCKGFCGYQVSKSGREYIFSFLVNNYDGRASELVNKMYKVLDNLKAF